MHRPLIGLVDRLHQRGGALMGALVGADPAAETDMFAQQAEDICHGKRNIDVAKVGIVMVARAGIQLGLSFDQIRAWASDSLTHLERREAGAARSIVAPRSEPS